jgi:hypothetical protein
MSTVTLELMLMAHVAVVVVVVVAHGRVAVVEERQEDSSLMRTFCKEMSIAREKILELISRCVFSKQYNPSSIL